MRGTRRLARDSGPTELSAKWFIELANPQYPGEHISGHKANDQARARAEANPREIEEWGSVGTKVEVI
jgi:hypothetical protein